MNLIVFLSFFLLSIVDSEDLSANSYEIREQTLTRPYPNVFSTATSHWHITGNTIVTDRYVRLTFDTQSKSGGLWNSVPVTYPDWEMHVKFQVHGEGKSFFGDGFAIWYVRDPKKTGPVFGYDDYFYGMGIFVDTYANRNQPEYLVHPYISVMINNGTLHYDHDVDGLSTSIAGCHALVRDQPTETIISIRYQNDRLTVSTQVDGTNVWSECFSIDQVYLPLGYFFGFTAATGELTDNHDIISIHTYRLDDKNGPRTNFFQRDLLPSGPPPNLKSQLDQKMKSTIWGTIHLVVKIFFAIVLSVIFLFFGLFYWKNRRDARRFRY